MKCTKLNANKIGNLSHATIAFGIFIIAIATLSLLSILKVPFLITFFVIWAAMLLLGIFIILPKMLNSRGKKGAFWRGMFMGSTFN